MSGPSVVPGSVPGPGTKLSIRATKVFAKSSATDRCTRMRLAATHASPPLRVLATIAPAAASSTSASAQTMKGALPPSSIETRSTRSAACAMSRRPTSVEPVKESLRSRSSAISGPVTSAGRVVGTTLTTPAGTPASTSTWVSSSEVSGVSSAGLSTTVHPAARAGAILRVAIASGKFHGVMSSEGPTGRMRTSSRLAPSGAVE
jgi:hypothetical protein